MKKRFWSNWTNNYAFSGLLSCAIFSNLWKFFQTWNFSNFCKEPAVPVGKLFLWNEIICYALYSKFTTYTILKVWKKFKFFFKKPIVFRKPKFLTFGEILLIQSHSAANLLEISHKKCSRSEHLTLSLTLEKTSTGKNVKESLFSAFLGGWFSLFIINMGLK